MILVLSLFGGACFWAMCVGLVVGEGWLRVGGLAGVVLCYAAALVLAWLDARKHGPQVESHVEPGRGFDVGDHFDAIEIVWPRPASEEHYRGAA